VFYLHKYSRGFSNFDDIVIQFFRKSSVMTVATLYMDNSETHHLIEGKITPELIYACSYWATHLSKVDLDDIELRPLLHNFAFKDILHWVEVLSLIGRLDIAYPALEHARRFLVSQYNSLSWNTVLLM
jgi:hypothetical protein